MTKLSNKQTGPESFFSDLKREILKLDPVAFCESYLNIDGKPLKLSNTGWRFFADMYRYLALEAITPSGRWLLPWNSIFVPLVFLEHRLIDRQFVFCIVFHLWR